jgi:hypothetical protein
MSSDKPTTPVPDAARRRQTDSERAAEARRYLAEYERHLAAQGMGDGELAAMEGAARASVPVWGLELGRQQSDMERTLTRLVATTEHVVSSVRETTEQMRGLGAQVQGLSDAVKGRGGVEVQLERHREDAARSSAAQDSRLAAVEQWMRDRDRTDTIRVSEAQRSWWDKGVGIVGAAVVMGALGLLGGATLGARGCEPAPPAVKAP